MGGKGQQRRLSAILAADVAGYTRLVEQDTDGTVAAWQAARADIIDPAVSEHSGRIVKHTGDGFLAEFSTVQDAVRCAITMQEGLPESLLDFRIGINLGDVIDDGEDIHGEGVNIAARIEALANPGGICISGGVYDQVRNRLDHRFEDLGEHEVKHVSAPVRVYRIVVSHIRPVEKVTSDLALPEKPSIAVLPFENLSGEPEQQYFADGLSEDLITALTRWRSFPVIARNSSFGYKDKTIDIKRVARELGVRYVLEGSVRKVGARVRITAQLVDGMNAHHLWAEKYDRELDDIFEVQDDIVQRITAVVVPELDKAELARSTDKRSEDLDAWDLCMRAKSLLRQKTREGDANARDLFSRAIAIRADYADAHAGLAQSYNQDILIGAAEDRTAAATQAMEAARAAVRCDEASSWAHHELSTAYQWLNRIDDALGEARTAVELNPNDAYALHALGNKSDLVGDPNGISYMEKAQKLNPEDAQRHNHLTFLARAYVVVGNYGAAVERARQAIRRRPDHVPAHYLLGIALGHLGELDEARASLAKCDELDPGFVESRRNWRPYAEQASNERLREGLRALAG
jgi:adenylate cyclase